VRIAIDASSVPSQPAGAGVYAIELTRAMAARHSSDGFALFTRGHWLDESLEHRRNWRIERVAASSRVQRFLWEQTRLPASLRSLGIDVLHSTHHTLPLLGAPSRRVVTIHDLTFLRIPRRYPAVRRLYMQTLTRLSARLADAIIVPSETVRGDVIRLLGAPGAKVAVVYEAAGEQYRPVDPADAAATARRYGLEGPYILSVGSLEPGKNRPRLIRALHRLRGEGIPARLAVVGQKAWRYDAEIELVQQLGMQHEVVFLGYVPAPDMPALYAGAMLLALPSLYEGFGLPVLEAMACGTPVLTSALGATAEVAADAARLVDPRSVDAIATGLRELLPDADLRAAMSRRGLARAGAFSWSRAADETYEVYRGVARPRTDQP